MSFHGFDHRLKLTYPDGLSLLLLHLEELSVPSDITHFESHPGACEWRGSVSTMGGEAVKSESMIPILFGLVGLAVLIAVLMGIFVVGAYNRLVSLRNRFKNAYAQIDVQLKRRHDLIPNLVETARGYLSHERETLEAVVQARTIAASAGERAAAQPGDPAAMRSLGGAEGVLNGALGKLFALREAYPDLKANRTMDSLMEELASTENKVAFARQAYNDSVMNYNTAREIFPSNIVAGIFQFTTAELFEIQSPEEKEAPAVRFS